MPNSKSATTGIAGGMRKPSKRGPRLRNEKFMPVPVPIPVPVPDSFSAEHGEGDGNGDGHEKKEIAGNGIA